ncbi:hypothetical protein PIB30_027715 [Stylosanthes scabra]|uniref:Aminotransferase-like plant mobile domain-containing protein n=1 Tax=Stylosanthes scabra TaxID=79078 RepID=A0ABU6V8V5_9FABA|nr:hypothetical protein [Stylosanthes scabra]
MSRTKQTGRRPTRELLPPLPCLSNYAEEDWFEEESEKKAYSEHLSRMHIIPPRYVGDGAIPKDKYPEFWRLIDVQGLRQFLLQREGDLLKLRKMMLELLMLQVSWVVLDGCAVVVVSSALFCWYYPRFVAAAFASVVTDDKIGDDGQGTFHLCVSFMGRTFNFLLERIAEAWGLRNAGTTFRRGNSPHSEWNEFEKMDAARALRLDPASSGKYHISRMTTTHRLLLYVISRILIPQKINHGSATEEDLILLWAMINEKQINWPYLMAHKLVEYSHGKVNSALGLPHLWEKVFPLIPLDVSQEEFVASKSEFAITSKNINQMRRNLDNPNAAEEDIPERNVRPRTDVGSSSQAPRETGETSQSQPNFMEILLKSFEALQARVDEGFAKLTNRIDSMDISLISRAEEMRMLRDRFLVLVGEVPPSAEPTTEGPTDAALTVKVPTTDPPVVDEVVAAEVTRTDDPAAEGATATAEVAQVEVSSVEGAHVATSSVEAAQEHTAGSPVQD